jgi:hypothetical protein
MEPNKLVKSALDSSVALIKKGTAPTEALEKVAREMDLNSNYIQRAGEALNVVLHYNHFKVAENKAENFPIADIQEVTKNIYGEKEKSATVKNAGWFKPQLQDINYNKRLTSPKFKTASQNIRKTEIQEEFPTSFKGQYKKAVEYISRLEKEIDEMRVEKAAAKIQLEGIFNAVVSGFKKSAAARIPFHQFETSAYTIHGDRAIPYIDLVYKAAGLKEDRGTHDKFKIAAEVDSPLIEYFNQVLKLAAELPRLEKELAEAEQYVSLSRAQLKEANHKLVGNPEALPNLDKIACDALADQIGELLEKEAGQVSRSLVETLVKSYQEAKEKKKTPAFANTKLDNRDRTSMLQELIMTDPILAHQDPKKILSAYQQVLRLAPHLAKEKEVVRSLLRQLTATQSLAPVEANQLVEANTNLLKQHQLFRSHTGDDKKSK